MVRSETVVSLQNSKTVNCGLGFPQLYDLPSCDDWLTHLQHFVALVQQSAGLGGAAPHDPAHHDRLVLVPHRRPQRLARLLDAHDLNGRQATQMESFAFSNPYLYIPSKKIFPCCEDSWRRFSASVVTVRRNISALHSRNLGGLIDGLCIECDANSS